MIIERVTDISIIDEIKEHFIEDGAYTKEVCADDIKREFNKDSSDVCIIVARDNGIVGFVVAWVLPMRDYVWLDQAFNISSPEIAKQGFELLVQWCISKGIYKIKMETTRKSMPIHKRYGFIEHGAIMVKELNNG